MDALNLVSSAPYKNIKKNVGIDNPSKPKQKMNKSVVEKVIINMISIHRSIEKNNFLLLNIIILFQLERRE